MSLTLNTIAPNAGSHERSRRIGRGPGSGRGKTAGKGTKGQRSRSGGKKGLILKGMKQMLLSFPKNRGFRSLAGKAATIPLERLEVIADGTKVDMAFLREAGFVKRADARIKLVSGGTLTKKLVVVGLPITAGAKEQIEKAGGSVTIRSKKNDKKNKKNANKKR